MGSTDYSLSGSESYNVQIRALGALEIAITGQVLDLSRRRVRKPLELLRWLVAAGPGGLQVEDLRRSFWPDSSSQAAQRALITTLFRLRRLLGSGRSVHLSNQRVWLDTTVCRVDAWQFEAGMASPPGSFDPWVVLAQYRGALFQEQESELVMEARQRLRRLFTQAVHSLCRTLVATGKPSEARKVLEAGIAAEPAAEELHRALIDLLGTLGLANSATIAYQRCALALRQRCGLQPSAATKAAWRAATLGQRTVAIMA